MVNRHQNWCVCVCEFCRMLTAPSCHSDLGEWQAGALRQLIVSVFSCEWVRESEMGGGREGTRERERARLEIRDRFAKRWLGNRRSAVISVFISSPCSFADIYALFHSQSQTLCLAAHTYTQSELAVWQCGKRVHEMGIHVWCSCGHSERVTLWLDTRSH